MIARGFAAFERSTGARTGGGRLPPWSLALLVVAVVAWPAAPVRAQDVPSAAPGTTLHVELAPRVRAIVDAASVMGVRPAEIRDVGPGLIATLDGATLTVDALRGASGSSHVMLATDDGGSARLDVTFATAPWAIIGDRPYLVTFAGVGDPAVSAEAWSLVEGRVVETRHTDGCASVDVGSRAFGFPKDADSELPEEPMRGCVRGVADGDRLVGEIHLDDEERAGIVIDLATSTTHLVRVGNSWGTRLLAASGPTLLGAVRDETGVERAAWLEPLPLRAGITFATSPEPKDPDLAHACGHALGGPFSPIEAALDPADAGAIERPHTSYEVALPLDPGARQIRLRSPRDGQVTLHLGALIGLRLRAPDGSLVDASFADDTTTCEGLRGFIQYDLPEAGVYVLELGPTTRERVTIVYERSWVIEPG